MKNLTDANRLVRVKAGCALAKLLLMNPRLDQLMMDIHNLLGKNAASSATTTAGEITTDVRETLCNTLRLCFNNVGAKLTDETKTSMMNLLRSEQYMYNPEEEALRAASAGAFGSLLLHLSPVTQEQVIGQLLATSSEKKSSGPSGWVNLHGNCLALTAALRHSANGALLGLSASAAEEVEKKLVAFLLFCVQHEKVLYKHS
jgi:hypothetical protein